MSTYSYSKLEQYSFIYYLKFGSIIRKDSFYYNAYVK